MIFDEMLNTKLAVFWKEEDLGNCFFFPKTGQLRVEHFVENREFLVVN